MAEFTLTELLWTLLIFALSSLPLYFAVKLLGGRTTIVKTFLVNVIVAILAFFIGLYLPYANIVTFILLIWIYREMFRLRWIKSLIAWLLHIVFYIALTIVLGLFGLGVYGFVPLLDIFQ